MFSLKNYSLILNKLSKKEITQSFIVITERAKHPKVGTRVRQEKRLGYKGTWDERDLNFVVWVPHSP